MGDDPIESFNPNFNPNFVIFRLLFLHLKTSSKLCPFLFGRERKGQSFVDISLDHERSRAN